MLKVGNGLDCAARPFCPSGADIIRPPRHVRKLPEGDIREHEPGYSIGASASVRKLLGTLIPSCHNATAFLAASTAARKPGWR